MQPIRFSLIVPTRERVNTLRFCLQTLVAQTYENLEIIVSDNASTDGTEAFVKSLKDSRIRYVNTGQRVGMSQNWEFALKHATGDWIGYVGDDDGLLPGCFEKIQKLIETTQAKAIRTRACSYIWPNAQPQGDHLAMNVPLGKTHQWRKSSQWIDKALAGHVNYSELPMLYNGGFVQKSLLDDFSQMHGQVFFSRIPDVYSGMLIASLVDEYVYSTEPVAINGTSASSTGYAQFRAHDINGAPKQHSDPSFMFAQEANLPFHASLPLMRDGDIPKSLQALIFESYAQVADRIPAMTHMPPLQVAQGILNSRHSMSSELIAEWTDDFRKKHNISEASQMKSPRLKRPLNLLRFIFYRVSLVRHSFFFNDLNGSVSDIFAASVVAGNIHRTQPQYFWNVASHLFKTYLRTNKTL